MSKKFEEAYKEYLNSQAPDLWGRINDRLDAERQDCLEKTADDNVVELRRQKHRRAKKNRGRYIRLYGAIAACVAALILAVPVLRIVKGGSGSQMDSYELAKVENGEIENITEEAAEEAAPPAEETTQMAAADTAGSETDGISVVETNEAAAQENEQAQEPSDEAASSEEDGNAVDANVMESSTLAAEAGNTCVVLYEDIKVKILTADVREDGIYYTAEVTASAYEDAFSVGTTCNLYADTDAQPLVAEQEYTLTLAAGERAECYKIVQ